MMAHQNRLTRADGEAAHEQGCLGIAAIVACAIVVWVGAAVAEPLPSLRVEIRNEWNESIGTATIWSAGPLGLHVILDAHRLPPGDHAVHVHQNAVCEPPTFESAGPHLNPDQRQHGLSTPEGGHAGDLYNVVVRPDGVLNAMVSAPRLSLGGDRYSVRDNGASIVIHAMADDMKSDPAGGSGDRIACAVIDAARN
jgi:Cu-Zn family superoxide dismutase